MLCYVFWSQVENGIVYFIQLEELLLIQVMWWSAVPKFELCFGLVEVVEVEFAEEVD